MMETLGRVIAGLAMTVLGVVLGAWVLTVLWGWFIVPGFGLRALSLSHAIGLNLVVGMLTIQKQPHQDESQFVLAQLGKALSDQIGLCIVVLLIGYIAHFYV